MPKNINETFTGGVKDETLSNKTLNYLLSLPEGELLSKKVKYLIGEYRFWRKSRETIPNKSTTIRHLEKIDNQITNLINDIKLIPPDVLAVMDEASYNRHGELFFSIQQRLENDLYSSKFLICDALGKADKWKQKKGVKKRKLENILLAEVAILLRTHAGLGKGQSAILAASLLNENTQPLYLDINGKKIKNNFPCDENETEAARQVRETIKQFGLNDSKLD